MMQRNELKSSFGSMVDESKFPRPWKWPVCIDTLHNVSIHLVQKPCLYRYNDKCIDTMSNCIDTMNHCIDTCWCVSIQFFTECMFWFWHGPVSIHEVWYRYRGLCIDTSTCCIDTNGDISNFCHVGALYRYIQVKLWIFSYRLSSIPWLHHLMPHLCIYLWYDP